MASGISSFGKEFYIGIPANLVQDRSNHIQLDIASKIPGEVRIFIPYLSFNKTQTINKSLKFTFNSKLELFTTGKERRGIYISSSVHISVFVTSYTLASGDTFLAFPLDVLGTEYDVIAYTANWKPGFPSEVVFVAPFNGTIVNMTIGNQSTVVTLNHLDLYQMLTTTEDLTGAIVTSNKPIAVFSAASCDFIGNTTQRCNMKFAQLLPTDEWGTTAIVPPIALNRPMELLFYGLNDTASYCIAGQSIGQFCFSESKGGTLYHTFSSTAVSVQSATNDRFVAILYKQQEAFMALIPAIEQFSTEYYVVFPDIYTTQAHFLTITVQNVSASGILLDGQLPPKPMAVIPVPYPFTDYIIITYQMFSTGYHTITHRDGNVRFGAFCYGYGNFHNHVVDDIGFAAYGFPAGFHEGPPILGVTCLNGGTSLGTTCLCASRFAGEFCQIDADCTFDMDTLCYWTNPRSVDNFDWVVHHESTPTDDTGPENDHTLGTANGAYVYIESSAPRVKDEKAWLQSPEFNPTGPQGLCLNFWYSMNGESSGQLNVYKGNGSTAERVWTLTGEQGTQWKQGIVKLVSQEKFVVTFEATVGDGYLGDIALDDISFTSGMCLHYPNQATSASGILIGR
ncbi:hypothetical protein DPMN_101411 [Dreissena polymorpha]|uniref:MAM domain-containing protein n=2 Tax=Dreissena polymorpha TaxID=45954 RepID=A0A9D4R8B2_DREPO|nr:hypothetical protein DPMN_101411 [Dreissena polymorpha]